MIGQDSPSYAAPLEVMRAVLALLAFILVFFALNVDRLVTIAWWKQRRIEAIAYRQAGSAVIGRRLGDPSSVFNGSILTYMAGPEAEREFGFTPGEDVKDREEIASMLQWLPKSDVGHEQQLRKKACGLVRRHKAKIDLVAKELSKRRKLLADEIDALLASFQH